MLNHFDITLERASEILEIQLLSEKNESLKNDFISIT